MLLRVKEETGEEIAGFVEALRAAFAKPASAPPVDLDWPSGRQSRQLPWYLLAALALAVRAGACHDGLMAIAPPAASIPGETLARFGVPARAIRKKRRAIFSLPISLYLSLEISPVLAMAMVRASADPGLRSPVHAGAP